MIATRHQRYEFMTFGSTLDKEGELQMSIDGEFTDKAVDHNQLRITRRDLLRGAVAVGGLMTTGGLLAACGASNSGSPGASVTTLAGESAVMELSGTPRRGGSLRVGMVTAGGETQDPALIYAPADYVRCGNLYSTLFRISPDLQPVPLLAVSAEPNATADLWTIKLRDGVTFHNGKTMTAEDVVASILSWADSSNYGYLPLGVYFDTKGVRQVGNLEVQVAFKQPFANLPLALGEAWYCILPNGQFDPKHPIGTGPFSYESFSPGVQSTYLRFPNYFEEGQPYVDELVVNSSFQQDTALVNALAGGDLDVVPYLPPTAARSAGSSYAVLRATGTQFNAFTMRVDQAPFNDVRIRQAMRLLIDRQQMVDVVLDGYGSPISDNPSPGLEFWDGSLHRSQNIAEAKSLLKSAGESNLTVTLQTSTAGTGFVQAAELFASQVQGSGVTIKVKQDNPGPYFGPQLYTKMTFAQTFWPLASLQYWYAYALVTGCSAPETHWNNPQTDKWFYQASGELDDTKAGEIWDQLQTQQFSEGGYIAWGVVDNLDGLNPKIRGITPSKLNPSNNFRYSTVWFAQ